MSSNGCLWTFFKVCQKVCERLKRKRRDTGDDEKKKNVYGLGVEVESAKKGI